MATIEEVGDGRVENNAHEFPVETRPLYVGTGNFIDAARKVTDRVAIVRPDTEETVAIVSNGNYQLIPHKAVVDCFEDALTRLPGPYNNPDVVTYLPKNGSKMIRRYTFSGIDVGFKSNGGSEVLHPTVEIRNSIDATWSIGFQLGVYRVVCINGQIVGIIFQKLSFVHSAGLELKNVTQNLITNLNMLPQAIETWQGWDQVPWTPHEGYNQLNDAELADYAVTAILKQFTIEADTLGQTKWAWFQAITFFISHQVRIRRATRSNARLRQVHWEDIFRRILYTDV
jgi:hypothetical protein